jgi:hypothetical protein
LPWITALVSASVNTSSRFDACSWLHAPVSAARRARLAAVGSISSICVGMESWLRSNTNCTAGSAAGRAGPASVESASVTSGAIRSTMCIYSAARRQGLSRNSHAPARLGGAVRREKRRPSEKVRRRGTIPGLNQGTKLLSRKGMSCPQRARPFYWWQ